ncbi:hypothetical protein BZA77DRAFT_39614 [Pyronema omphalodes]|nr:hypothetical protein BZA77DRAFT_39614 [Pyronema omphalodes]
MVMVMMMNEMSGEQRERGKGTRRRVEWMENSRVEDDGWRQEGHLGGRRGHKTETGKRTTALKLGVSVTEIKDTGKLCRFQDISGNTFGMGEKGGFGEGKCEYGELIGLVVVVMMMLMMMGCIADDLSTRGALIPVLSTLHTHDGGAFHFTNRHDICWYIRYMRYGTVRSNKITINASIPDMHCRPTHGSRLASSSSAFASAAISRPPLGSVHHLSVSPFTAD